MSDSAIKKFNYSFTAVYIVIFIGFIIFQESPSALSGDRDVWKPVVEALFLTIIGAMFSIVGIVNSIAIWTRTADQYMKLLHSMAIGSWGKRSLRFCSNRYWLWQGRVILILFFFMGLAFFYVGLLRLQNILFN